MSQIVATFRLFFAGIPLRLAHPPTGDDVRSRCANPRCLITFQEAEMYSIRTLGVGLAILLALSGVAFAQGTADIVGRVTDTSGGVLPAVTVTAENIATKSVRTTVTSDTGDYVFTLLPVGVYTVKI